MINILYSTNCCYLYENIFLYYQIQVKKAKTGAYVVAPEGLVGSAGHIYGVAKDSMGGSDAIVWKDANSQETWDHTCKESLRQSLQL